MIDLASPSAQPPHVNGELAQYPDKPRVVGGKLQGNDLIRQRCALPPSPEPRLRRWGRLLELRIPMSLPLQGKVDFPQIAGNLGKRRMILISV